jgi:hypothetical protein
MLPMALFEMGEYQQHCLCGSGSFPEALQVVTAYFGSRVFSDVTIRLASPS